MKSTFFHIRQNLRWYILLLLTIFGIILWCVTLTADQTGLTFAALNISQGDSLFIESPSGVKVLMDGGPDDNLIRQLPHVMPWWDKHIDAIIITNSDSDHYGGFISLLQTYKVDVVVESGYRSATSDYALLEKEIAEKHIPEILARLGEVIDLGDGAQIKILFPDRDVSGLASNDASIVSRLTYGETSVLLTGDSTKKIEDYLIQLDGPNLQSTILKVGHHGSNTSSSDEYVKIVSPQFAVISDGQDNTYGLPDQQTLDTLNKYKVPIYDTCVMGNIILHSDGKQFTLENKNTAPVAAGCK
jgi:competence protein ComEC